MVKKSNKFNKEVYSKIWNIFVWSNQFDQILKNGTYFEEKDE